MTDEIPNEVKTQIGTFIFNEYGNPDFRCTASEWLRRHHFIINSVTKSNIVSIENRQYFRSRGAVLINDTEQKSDHGKLKFDPIKKTVLPNCEFGGWLIRNNIDPEKMTIDNFKFDYKNDYWTLKPSQAQIQTQCSSNQSIHEKSQEINQVLSSTVSTNQQNDQSKQPNNLNVENNSAKPKAKKIHQTPKKQEVIELQLLLNKQQMRYIRRMKRLQQMQNEYLIYQMQNPFQFQQNFYTPFVISNNNLLQSGNKLTEKYEESTENEYTKSEENEYTESEENEYTESTENGYTELEEEEEEEESVYESSTISNTSYD